MRVQNEIDRYHLVIDVLNHIENLDNRKVDLIRWCNDKLDFHYSYIRNNGEDMKDVLEWTWNGSMKDIIQG